MPVRGDAVFLEHGDSPRVWRGVCVIGSCAARVDTDHAGRRGRVLSLQVMLEDGFGQRTAADISQADEEHRGARGCRGGGSHLSAQ